MKLRVTLMFGVLALLATACGGGGGQAVATVNGEEITAEYMASIVGEGGQTINVNTEDFRQSLSVEIVWAAVIPAAQTEFGLSVSEDDVAERMANPPARYQALFQDLATQNATQEYFEVDYHTTGPSYASAYGLVAAYHRSTWIDKFIMAGAVVGMSISFLIAIIAFQLVFSSSYGLDAFPVRGWDVYTLGDYLYYVTVPTLATVFVALGYNTRFYRAVIVEEMTRDHVRTARAFGTPPVKLLYKNILKNSMIPIITRIMFSIPLIVISGSLLIEQYFGIPGVGKVTYEAITTGDQPVLKAVVGLTAVLFVLTLLITDMLYALVDPRVRLK